MRAYAFALKRSVDMRKNLEKIFASCSIVVAIILIMVLIVTAFGGIDAEEFDSKLVRGLILTLAILYIALAVISLVLIFINNDVVKEITLRAEKGGSVRVTSQVVTKLVKSTCKQLDGVKCQKVALVTDEYGVRLKVNVKVVDRDVIEAETYLRTLLEDVFLGEFGFKFSSIEIKVMALTPKYKADEAEIQARVEEKLAQIAEENKEQEQQEKVVLEAVDTAAESEDNVAVELEDAQNESEESEIDVDGDLTDSVETETVAESVEELVADDTEDNKEE